RRRRARLAPTVRMCTGEEASRRCLQPTVCRWGERSRRRRCNWPQLRACARGIPGAIRRAGGNTRMKPNKSTGTTVCVASISALALACVNQAGDAEPPLEAMSLESLFEDAAAEFDVPADLLMAVGFAETGWEMVEGGREFEGVAPAYGVMGLRGDRLTEAAALAGVDPDGARYDEQDN